MRRILFLGFFVLILLLGGIYMVLVSLGGVDRIGDKFISVLLPGSRNSLPLIDSVSEHLPLAWGNLYFNLSTLVFFIPLGIYFSIKKPTEKNLFILTFTLLTIYFSGSMVRLMLILAPAAAISTALAIDNLLIPYAYAAHGRIKLTKTTMSMPSIGPENAAISYIAVFVFISIMIGQSVNIAGDYYANPELTPGEPTNAHNDWLEAFDWMRKHSSYKDYTKDKDYRGLKNEHPPLMLSWWDYGYYITSQGKTISLVDNATFNSTQIGVVGTMLMWNASASIKLMYMYNVKYILVVPFAGLLSSSDIGKSVWMIRISEQYTKYFGVSELKYMSTDPETGGTIYSDLYYSSVLYKLMAYRGSDMEPTSNYGAPPFIDQSSERILPQLRSRVVDGTDEDMKYFKEVFRSTGLVLTNPGAYPIVRIFEVKYPDNIELQVREFQNVMFDDY